MPVDDNDDDDDDDNDDDIVSKPRLISVTSYTRETLLLVMAWVVK